MFQTKVLEKTKTRILYSVTSFRKSCRLRGNVVKMWYSQTGHRWQHGACAWHAG